MTTKQRRRQEMHGFTMSEISAVDKPAQSPALMAIMKREEPPPAEGDPSAPPDLDIIKRARLTSVTDGHQHVLDDDALSGTTSYASRANPNGEYAGGHSHPWIRTDDGKIVLGVVMGHTHDIEGAYRVIKSQHGDKSIALLQSFDYGGGEPSATAPKETSMTKTAAEQAAEQQAEALAKAQADLARANSILSLNAEERSHFDKMAGDAAAQDAFLALNAGLRKVAIQKAAEENAVVYTAADGTEYRKSDDPRLVQMAKNNDLLAKGLNASLEAQAEAQFKKQANDELKHLPGTEAEKVAMLKSIAAIPDQATRDAALKSLKAGSDALAKNFNTLGTTAGADGGGGDAQTPTAQLNALAKKYAADNKMDFAKAYTAVLATPEGDRLYNEAEAAKRPN